MQKKGKGIVLLPNWNTHVEYNFFGGSLQSSIPIEFERPQTLTKKYLGIKILNIDHFLMRDFSNFFGNLRKNMHVLEKFDFEEKMECISIWDCNEETPFIVIKNYYLSKEKWGRIIVLNFCPLENNGNILLQNSIIFSCRKEKFFLLKEENMKKQQEKLFKISKIIKHDVEFFF